MTKIDKKKLRIIASVTAIFIIIAMVAVFLPRSELAATNDKTIQEDRETLNKLKQRIAKNYLPKTSIVPDNLFAFYRRSDQKFGFVDSTGQIAIEPSFDQICLFSEGLACVARAGKWGYIDKTGKFVIEPQFEYANNFSEGVALILTTDISSGTNKGFYIDQSGNTVLSPPYDQVTDFHEGLAAIKIGDKEGYMDKQGNIVIQPQFEFAGIFNDGIAPVIINTKPAYIDKTGKIILTPAAEQAWPFYEGLAAVSQNGKFGFIDTSGKFVIPPIYKYVLSFHEGLAFAQTENSNKFGFIDTAGNMVIPERYDNVYGQFVDGLALVISDNKAMLIDKTGASIANIYDQNALTQLHEVLAENAQQEHPDGIYQLEQQLVFNVLDQVVLNSDTNQITLIGHLDENYFGPKIPYLQHLATFLDNPHPEFSLRWTTTSEASVDALMQRMDSLEEVKKISYQWGQVVDSNGKVTTSGRWLLPLWGVQPPEPQAADPWEHADSYYIIMEMLGAAGRNQAKDIIILMAAAARTPNATYEDRNNLFNALIYATNSHDIHVTLDNQLRSGQISQYDAFIGLHHAVLSGMEQVFGLSGEPLVRKYDQVLSTSGTDAAFSAALTEMGDHQLYIVLDTILNEFFNRYDEFQVPPEVMYATLGVQPEVMPEYTNLAPNSQLARVMFGADYLGKQLINTPALTSKFSSYQTEFQANRAGASNNSTQKTSTHHLWISVAKLDVAQSTDGYTLATRDAQMRFNIREKDPQGHDLPKNSNYEELLTSLYNDFSKEFPILHELRECAKLAAAAVWLQSKNPELKLPQHGRVQWHGPNTVPGLIYMTWSPKPQPGMVNAAMIAMGGISLVPPVGEAVPVWPPEVAKMVPTDRAVTSLRDDNMVVMPEIYDNKVLKQILRRKVDVPVPPVAGWVGGATKGARVFKAVSVIPISEQFDTAEAVTLQNKLNELKYLAFQLKTVDNAINTLNKKGFKQQKELADLEKELKEARNENIEIAKSSLESLLFQLPGFIKDKELLDKLGPVGKVLGEQMERQNPEKVETAWNTLKEVMNSEGSEQVINVLEQLYRGVIKVEVASPALKATLGRATTAIDIAETAQKAYQVTHNLGQLYSLGARLDEDTTNTDEWYAEMNNLTGMQKLLSDRVDQALKDPDIVKFLAK